MENENHAWGASAVPLHLSTLVVAELTGATRRRLGYWAESDLLRPSGRDAAGKGSRRQYTFPDLVALLTICKLRERGCPLPKIRQAVKYLKAHYPDVSDAQGLARLTLLTDGRQVYILTDERKIMEVVTRQHVWSVALGQLILEAQNGVEALPTEWTEEVGVGRRTYRLLVVRDADTGTFTTQCRELPGAIEQGDTAEQAIANGKEAIRSALAFESKRRAAGRRHVRAG